MAKAAETAAGGQAQRAAMKEAHRTHLQAVMQLIEKQEWEKLLDKDQLRGAQNTGDAFVGFNEGDSLFSPTFKVRRVEGIHYNPQRIPSYCDRVLWKSMPAWADHLQQESLESVLEVTTSDHKPVVSTFSLALSRPRHLMMTEPQPKQNLKQRSKSITAAAFEVIHDATWMRRRFSGSRHSPVMLKKCETLTPVVRIEDLTVSSIRATDLGGTKNDPYCIFYTNPSGMLGADPPVTTVRYKFDDLAGREAAVDEKAARIASKRTPANWLRQHRRSTWRDAEVPVLRPCTRTDEELQYVTLCIALYDYDFLSEDDLIGYVRVPLHRARRTFVGDNEYSFLVDEPIVYGNAINGCGRLSCRVTVSTGPAIHTALIKAQRESAGIRSTTLSRFNWLQPEACISCDPSCTIM